MSGAPNVERVSMSSAMVRIGLLLREVMLEERMPVSVQRLVAEAASAVEEEARQQLHRLRERAGHLDPADATALAIALAKSGEPAANEERQV